jgi:hypothetical protein
VGGETARSALVVDHLPSPGSGGDIGHVDPNPFKGLQSEGIRAVARTGSIVTATPASASGLSRLAAVQEQTRQLASSGIFVRALVALVAGDAILITLHVLQIFLRIFEFPALILESRMFSINKEAGYGEIFGYLKSIVITFCFLACYFRDRAPVFLALSFTFVVIVLDDSQQIHETFGKRFVEALALEQMAGVPAQNLGELIIWFALGAVVLAALAVGFLRSDVFGQNIALIFLGLLAVLIFFAVGMDTLRAALRNSFRGADLIWGLIENGGEMVTLSVITAAALTVAWCDRSSLVRPGPSPGRPLP